MRPAIVLVPFVLALLVGGAGAEEPGRPAGTAHVAGESTQVAESRGVRQRTTAGGGSPSTTARDRGDAAGATGAPPAASAVRARRDARAAAVEQACRARFDQMARRCEQECFRMAEGPLPSPSAVPPPACALGCRDFWRWSEFFARCALPSAIEVRRAAR